MAVDLESRLSVHLLWRLHGVDDRQRVRGVPAQVLGDAVQLGEESGEHFHGFDCDSWRLHWNHCGRVHSQAIPVEAKGSGAICTGLERRLLGLLRAVVLPGL